MDRVTCASSKDKHQRRGSKGCSSPQEYLGHLEASPAARVTALSPQTDKGQRQGHIPGTSGPPPLLTQ